MSHSGSMRDSEDDELRREKASVQLETPKVARALWFIIKFIPHTRTKLELQVRSNTQTQTIHTNCTVQAGKVKLSRENIRK